MSSDSDRDSNESDPELAPVHDDLTPRTLESRDLEGVAKFMQSADCKNVFVMVGAGMSVSAGIPDFRSPKTGLYSNLSKYNLPYAEAIFELTYFLEQPSAFYAFAAEFDPSKFRPTLAHSFVRLLDNKGLLKMCFTQNIDGLEHRAQIPADKLVEAHGTITTQHCAACQEEADGATMWEHVKRGEVMFCEHCEAPVKPDIVFFGEALPERFGECAPMLRQADLLLVLGTSLKVYPFAALATFVPPWCPRVLINLERAGNIGAQADDVLALGQCDKVVRELAQLLGWEEELEKEWETTKLPGDASEAAEVGSEAAGKNAEAAAERVANAIGKSEGKAKEETLDDVDKLAESIGKSLAIGEPDVHTKPKEGPQSDTTGNVPAVTRLHEVSQKVETADVAKSDGKLDGHSPL